MYSLAVIALAVGNALFSHGHYRQSKCCSIDEELIQINSSYSCVKNVQERLEINVSESDFLNTNSSGECVDVSGSNFFIFNISNGVVLDKKLVTENIFPKCCPLGYVYNSVLRSCEENLNADSSYISENFVKVGLPHCTIVMDHDLAERTNSVNTEVILKRKGLELVGFFCIDQNEKGSLIKRECKESLDVCNEIRCIKKCCPDGQSFINRAICYDTFTRGLNLTSFSSIDNPEDPYAIIYNSKCAKMYMMKEHQYTFNLDDRGLFSLWQNVSQTFVKDDVGQAKSYCIEHTKKKNIEGYFFFMCFPDKHINDKFFYTAWPKMLSCVCLVMTVAVYLILNETRNIFGKILVNYCSALFFENAILTYSQLSLYPSDTGCKLRSFSIIFFATASFTWSNVMCCDIWWTFGSAKRTLGAHQRKRELRKLLLYILYGWGVPTVLTLVILFFYSYRFLPYAIQPFLAVKKCFFERLTGNYGHALFFNLPHLIIQLVNMVLFMKTIIYCLKVKNEINKINDTTKDIKTKRFQKDKERLFLILKLSVIMGVSFIFEVVSAFFDMSKMGTIPKYIEIIWDTMNCSQGIFIFIIFICKMKIYRDFLLRFKILQPRTISTSSIHTQSTISNGTSMKGMRSINDFSRMA